MARSVTYRDKVVWIGLYKTYVRPILEYCVQAWRPWLAKDIKVLEDVQRRAVRQVRGLKGSCYEEKLKELDLFSLEYRCERGDAIQTWKILHKHDDVDESVWFERFSSEFDRNTRLSCGNMSLKHKLSQHEPRANSFSVRAPKIWNNLPDNVRSVEKLPNFKDAFDLYHKTRHRLPARAQFSSTLELTTNTERMFLVIWKPPYLCRRTATPWREKSW